MTLRVRLATLSFPVLARRARSRSRALRSAILIGASLSALPLGAACSRATPELGESRPPNIILIVMDTVRADHLGAYGYDRGNTPVLDAFAERSTVFTHAHTTAPWTLPSHASLFTGLSPPEHGSQMIRRQPGAQPKRALPLDLKHRTLAEFLDENGYRAGGVAANFVYLGASYRLNQGFSHWKVIEGELEVSAARASEVNEFALDWVRSRLEHPMPFFLFLNYMDAHRPYNTTASEAFPGYDVPAFDKRVYRETAAGVMGSAKKGLAEELRTVVDQYDLGLSNLDAGLGSLFAELDALDVFEDALVVVTSDHGEFLGEHGLLGHAKDVYEGTMWVPLLLKAPRQTQGARDDRPISLAHLPRLLIGMAGLEEKIREGDFPHAFPATPPFGQMRYSIWADMDKPWGRRFDRIRRTVYREGLKFIHSSDGAHELYDVAQDPLESRNLLEGRPELQQTWLARMREVEPHEAARTSSEPEGAPLTEKELEQLRALGYVE